ncbi:MAG: MlaC/ttg2D family ABC transporter substrate-binding protein [Nitrospinales bacterium]
MRMTKLNKIILAGCISIAVTFGGLTLATASEITDGLKSAIDRTIEIVVDPKYQKDKTSRRAAMRKIIDRKFNYTEMSRRSLAKNWNGLSVQQRQEFVQLFSKLLENSYASKIESYRDEQIIYRDEVVKGEYAMVKTRIKRADDKIDVDYKLKKSDGQWQIYDFVIEKVSMIRNYRSQFSKIIKRDSYDALVAKLTKKTKDLEGDSDEL